MIFTLTQKDSAAIRIDLSTELLYELDGKFMKKFPKGIETHTILSFYTGFYFIQTSILQ